MKALITGGAGFLGAHIVEHLLKTTNWDLVVLDRLDISGNLNRLSDMFIWEKEKHRVKFIWWDLKSEINQQVAGEIGDIDYIFHLAASSHVDRSIEDPLMFAMDNVVGTVNILQYARKCPSLKKFFNFSTDEVFGPAPMGHNFAEDEPHNPSNPYSASKSGQEAFGHAFFKTYKLPVITTHTMNVFGERQHPEKFIPLVMKRVLNDEEVIIHSDATKTISGSRFWIHGRNVAAALLFLVEKGIPGERYNIVGEKEVSNLEMAQFIAKVIGKPLKYQMLDFHSSRPGHDLRYALSGEKMKAMGWSYPLDFAKSLTKTVNWSLQHDNWLRM